jgi:hypothetical protein
MKIGILNFGTHKSALALLWLLGSGTVYGQMHYVSDNRSIGVSGFITPSGSSFSTNYSTTDTPNAPFTIFSGDLRKSVTWTDPGNSQHHRWSVTEASQNSSLGANEISGSGLISAHAFENPQISYGQGAAASSSFEVTFSLASATDFNLSGAVDFSPGGSFSVLLNSANHGNIFTGISANSPFSVSGTLLPDTYTLLAYAQTAGPAENACNGQYNFDLQMVPEPSSAALVIGGLIAAAVRRKRQ